MKYDRESEPQWGAGAECFCSAEKLY